MVGDAMAVSSVTTATARIRLVLPVPIAPMRAADSRSASTTRATMPDHSAPRASTRYTPPAPTYTKVSPRWVPVVMFALLGIGFVVIFLNYVGLVPGGTNNWYLLAGLGFILGGIITATQLH